MENNIQLINPNLKEKGKICEIEYSSGFNNIFEIYSPINNNTTKEKYIIFPKDNFDLNILNLKALLLIKKLKGHKKYITQIKYYSNKNKNRYLIDNINIEEIVKKNEEIENEGKDNNKNGLNSLNSENNENNNMKKEDENREIKSKLTKNENILLSNQNQNNNCLEYLISSDMLGFVFLWNVSHSYEIEYIIESNYQNYIYSILILFNINNYNFLITTTLGRFNNKVDFSKLYFLSNGKFFKNIYATNRNNTTYIIPWYNKNNNELYLIEFCRYYISINNILKDEVYHIFKNEGDYNKYYSGFIYEKNGKDYLVSCSYNGRVDVWNLFDKKLEIYLAISNTRLYSINNWNKNFFIVGDFNKGELIIIELNSFKIVTKIHNKNIKNMISLKKIMHPLHDDSLLILTNDGNIYLWTVN